MRLSLPVHSYSLRSAPASTARLVNCFAEALPPDAKSPTVLSRVPCFVSTYTGASGVVRGMHYGLGYLWAVIGTRLYRLNEDGSGSNFGTIPGTGRVSMASNADYIVVVTNPDAYYADASVTTAAQITDADFTARGAKYVRFIDNYLLFTEPGTGRFFGSDLASATSFDSLNFATAEGVPDNIVGMEVDHRQVLLFGSDSLEIWENTGASGFPFERAINGLIEIGCFNGDTVAKLDNSVFWVANDYTVRKLEGTTPRRVSTHAVEKFLSTVDINTGRAYSYNQDGHFFYVLSFEEGCWVYDATTGKWHERQTYGHTYYRYQTSAAAYGRVWLGDAYDYYVGYLDPDTYEDPGDVPQVMQWTYQPVYGENRLATHDRLEVIMETGVGLSSGQGSDPQIMCEYSDDGGQTWTTLPTKDIGALGSYSTRVAWHKLGSARQRVYRMSVSDPVKVAITDTILDVRGGRI